MDDQQPFITQSLYSPSFDSHSSPLSQGPYSQFLTPPNPSPSFIYQKVPFFFFFIFIIVVGCFYLLVIPPHPSQSYDLRHFTVYPTASSSCCPTLFVIFHFFIHFRDGIVWMDRTSGQLLVLFISLTLLSFDFTTPTHSPHFPWQNDLTVTLYAYQ